MKKTVVSVMLVMAGCAANAAEHQVKMLNTGKDGTMVFEPSLLKVAKGDSVKFIRVDPSHNSAAVIVPPGAVAWQGKMDEEISVKLDKEGVYVYICDPHKVMGMAGVIQVGRAVNVVDAKKQSAELAKGFVINKDRLAKALAQVK